MPADAQRRSRQAGRGAARPASIHSQDKHDLLGRIERYLDDTARAAEAEQVFKELESDPRSRKVEPPMPEGWKRITFIPGIEFDEGAE